MNVAFYFAAVVAIFATVRVITRLNAVHALLYLIVSLLSVAVIFYTLGAPFIAALEVIVYAGAIMVLFVFVVMMLNLGPETRDTERIWLKPGMFIGPCILAAMLIAEVAYLLLHAEGAQQGAASVGPKQVGMALFGPYLIGDDVADGPGLDVTFLPRAHALRGLWRDGRRHLNAAVNLTKRRFFFQTSALVLWS